MLQFVFVCPGSRQVPQRRRGKYPVDAAMSMLEVLSRKISNAVVLFKCGARRRLSVSDLPCKSLQFFVVFLSTLSYHNLVSTLPHETHIKNVYRFFHFMLFMVFFGDVCVCVCVLFISSCVRW